MYGERSRHCRRPRPSLRVGERVRISKAKKVFRRDTSHGLPRSRRQRRNLERDLSPIRTAEDRKMRRRVRSGSAVENSLPTQMRRGLRPSMRVGERVRIIKTKTKNVFRKAYQSSWATELFVVHRIVPARRPMLYRVRDSNGDVLKGTFYRDELRRIINRDGV